MQYMTEQLELFNFDEPVTLEEVFEAYYDCRKHKRKTLNALKFEIDYEQNLIELWRQINDGTYEIGKSIAFIVEKPVKREIFAADFKDRIVHHLVIKKLEPYFEKIFSPNSCSCRKGKGTLYAVKRAAEYVSSRMKQNKNGCYVLKMDIEAFFMSIDCNLLCEKLMNFIDKYYTHSDKNLIKKLVRQIVLNRPQKTCTKKSSPNSWCGLPRRKSLFFAKEMNGMPIGNLTLQVFANFYLNELDEFADAVPNTGYVRYVDDFLFVGEKKENLRRLIKKIRQLLKEKLGLTLHPRKIYLQHCNKGFNFTGVRIKGNTMLAGERLKRNFLNKINLINRLKGELTAEIAEKIRAGFNSYCGYMLHLKTYRMRLRGWNLLKNNFRQFFKCAKKCAYLVVRHNACACGQGMSYLAII